MRRRDFFKDAFDESFRSVYKSFLGLKEALVDIGDLVQQERDGTGMASGAFFDSYELSYSLTLAYPREMFEQMARDQGLPFEGVETIELAKELNRRGVI